MTRRECARATKHTGCARLPGQRGWVEECEERTYLPGPLSMPVTLNAASSFTVTRLRSVFVMCAS
ncbi:MAG: hypothetical protein QOD92_1032 [Acidimicrobiaceae bacterium]